MASDLILPGPGYAGFLHFVYRVPSQPGLMAKRRSSAPTPKVSVPDESMAVASDAGKKEVPNESMAVAATPDENKDKAWFENYEALKAYHAKRGDCAVPFGKKTGSLRSWLERQKKLHKDGQLESGKVEYLRALNVDLDGASPRGQAAKKQKTEEADAPGTPGGASVRVSHGAMPVKAKRGVKKSIGVIEGPETWDHNYAVLKMYKEEHGTVELTPGESKETDTLLGWAEKQKKAHSKADLNYDRINLLEELGMKLS